MRIRKVTPKDYKKISYLIQRNIEQIRENKYTKRETSAWKKANTPSKIKEKMQGNNSFIIIEGNKILGTITLMDNCIRTFFVDYRQRGKGIGSKLFEFIEKHAKKKKLKKLWLSSTPSALKFYKKRGYKIRGPYKFKTTWDVIINETKMEKVLK